jgi:hypothetical protein
MSLEDPPAKHKRKRSFSEEDISNPSRAASSHLSVKDSSLQKARRLTQIKQLYESYVWLSSFSERHDRAHWALKWLKEACKGRMDASSCVQTA